MSRSQPVPAFIHGWAVFAHPLFTAQLEALIRQTEAFKKKDPVGYVKKNAAKRLAAITKLAFDVIPQDPTRAEYRQGNTLGEEHKHWFTCQIFPAVPAVLSLSRGKQGHRARLGQRRGHQAGVREQR
jgi:toxin YhaV